MWFKVVSQGPLGVQVRLEFPVEAHQVVDGIVHGQADGHAGDQAGGHGQFDAQPSHDAEVDHDGKQVGHDGDQATFQERNSMNMMPKIPWPWSARDF
jgi:hypothetical protein